MEIEFSFLIIAILLIFSIVASKISSRFGIPALVLFLAIGMLAGSEGIGGIYFDNAALAQLIGVIALSFILFSGGLDTDWQAIRPVLVSGLTLANVGVVISTFLVGAFAVFIFHFSWLEGLLLGAIVSSTDAAAVFTVLRSSGVNLGKRLEPLLELESGSNDPIAVFLTSAFTGLLLDSGSSVIALFPSFAWEMAFGAVAGVAMGRLGSWIINRLRLVDDGLYPVLTIALVLLTYGGTAALHGNGFLAVYLAGIVMGNRDFIHKRSLMRFHDGLAWLVQIAMFLTLGLLAFPSHLVPVIGEGLLTALFLIFIARPLSVAITLLPFGFSVREVLMVSWSGLRGAVPIVLATFPLLAGLSKSVEIFNLVFFIVLASVLFQGTTISFVGKLLGIGSSRGKVFQDPRQFVPRVTIESRMGEIIVAPDSPLQGRSIVDLKLPRGALIVAITRDDERIVPNGGTVLQPGDRLLVLADDAILAEVGRLLAGASGTQTRLQSSSNA